MTQKQRQKQRHKNRHKKTDRDTETETRKTQKRTETETRTVGNRKDGKYTETQQHAERSKRYPTVRPTRWNARMPEGGTRKGDGEPRQKDQAE